MIFDIETTGLKKEEDRITCISCYDEELNKVTSFIDLDEKAIIEGFYKFLDEIDTRVLYSFNGDFFDIPFLIYRALKVRAKAPEGFRMPKSIDLRKIYHGFFYNYENIKFKKGNLNDIGKEFLDMESKSTEGLEVVKAWETKNLDLIKEHCEYDVVITYELFKRLKEVGLI